MSSGNFRKLSTWIEVQEAYSFMKTAWQNPEIPRRQYETAVKSELEAYRKGSACPPYSAFIKCVMELPDEIINNRRTKVLDVGASTGYYGEILEIAGYDFDYQASDYSPYFQTLAEELYPALRFTVANAIDLPFQDNGFDVVISGCVMIHVLEYEKIIEETARILRKGGYAIFNRTPINPKGTTEYFVKEAYGVPCLEIHFSEREIMDLMTKHGLEARFIAPIFDSEDFAMRTLLMRKR